MKKYFLFLLALPALAAPQITVSATALTLLGSNQIISLRVDLVDPNNTGLLRVNGTQIIPIMTASTITPGATATVGPIYGNDVIRDGFGNLNGTYYRVQVFPVVNSIVSATAAFQQFFSFTGAGTVDLATATPLAPSFMTGTSGSVVMPGNLSVTGTTTLTGATTAGTSTFTGASTFNGTVTAANIDTELYVAAGGLYTTLAAAISACPSVGCIIHDNLPETFSSDPFSGVGLTKAIHVFMGPGTWLTNVTITLPGTSMLEGSLIRANTTNNPTFGTIIKAGASFPTSTPVIKMTGTQGNVITKMGIDCNGVAGSTGIFATDINEKGGVREAVIVNCVAFGLNVDASQFTTIPAQNYFIQNVECFPNAGGTFGTGSTDCVHLKGNGGGGPGPISQITGSGTSGHVIGNTLSLENFSQGVISEVHGEFVTNVLAMLNAGVTQIQVNEVTSASTCTNLVNIPNTVTGNAWTFLNLGKASCTNTINDVPDGITDTAPTEALFVVGSGAIGAREIYATTSGVPKTIVGGPAFLGNINSNGAIYFKEGTSPGGAANLDMVYGDSTAHQLKISNNNGTAFPVTQTVVTGTSTLNSGSLTTNTCQATVTTAATNTATTDSIEWSFATVPGSADALTTVSATPTSGNVNFVRCNPTNASQTTTAIVINWRVLR
jgi:hypothetical protein